jgi:hypothetical protein
MERHGKLLRVHGSRRCVVSKAEPVPVASSPFIEKTLIGTVPTAFGFWERHELFELVLPRGQDHEARVEYVRPAHIWYRREIMRKCKEVREWTNWKDIRVKKDYLRVLGEAKGVEFREDGIKIRATWEGRVLESTGFLGENNKKKAAGEA